MIHFEEALKLIVSSAYTLGTKHINYKLSIGKVLAQDIKSDINMPPFNKSAMDGYACRKSDLSNLLEVIEIIPAGVSPTKKVGKNQCSKIMTGAPVPEGADTVIKIEDTENISKEIIKFTKEKSKKNICYLGEDVKTNDIVLQKGTIIRDKHIPVFATVGATEIEVFKAPTVAVISTGNELVEPNIKPNPSQIRNSNAHQMLVQAQGMGVDIVYIGIAKDTLESTREMLLKAMEQADIIIVSGAVSMGDFDFVPVVLKNLCIDIKFHGVHTKPGKRTVFGTGNNKWFVGVPGNPVSAFVQFEMLIKPLIYKIMGSDYKTKTYKLSMHKPYKRRKALRKAFIPIKITNDGTIEQIDYHGSAHINSLTYADGLMIVESGVTEINKGDFVYVRPI